MVIGTTYIAQQKLECAGWWKVEVALLGWAVRFGWSGRLSIMKISVIKNRFDCRNMIFHFSQPPFPLTALY